MQIYGYRKLLLRNISFVLPPKQSEPFALIRMIGKMESKQTKSMRAVFKNAHTFIAIVNIDILFEFHISIV